MRTAIRPVRQDVFAVVLVVSGEDWTGIRSAFPDLRPGLALNREWISRAFGRRRVVFVLTGDECIAASATAQHAVDQWRPLILLSTVPEDSEEAKAFRWVAENNRVPLLPARDEASGDGGFLDGFEERLERAAPNPPRRPVSVPDAEVVGPDGSAKGTPPDA